MKIELDANTSDINIIDSYSNDGVIIKNTVYQNSIIVSPQQVVADWPPQSISDLSEEHFEQIITMSPEILLIGTGNLLVFPADQILESMLKRQIGVEVMDTGAACRAYNFIAGEGRLVVAALLPPEN